MSKERDELRVRVSHDLAAAIDTWAAEKYPYLEHGRRQLLLSEILEAAVKRRHDTVIVQKFRQRRKQH